MKPLIYLLAITLVSCEIHVTDRYGRCREIGTGNVQILPLKPGRRVGDTIIADGFVSDRFVILEIDSTASFR